MRVLNMTHLALAGAVSSLTFSGVKLALGDYVAAQGFATLAIGFWALRIAILKWRGTR